MDERTQWLARIDRAISELTGRNANHAPPEANERSDDDEALRASDAMKRELT